ncbi:MAG: molybdenum cofactor guanylyltransferase MobA [Paracoccaceae bacterium]
MRIFGLILAGGEARRFDGADKALLPLAGQPLLAHVIARFSPQVEALALSANDDPSRFSPYGLPILADAESTRLGPMAGLLAGFDWAAAQGATHLATASVDTPFLPCEMVARLVLAGEGHDTPVLCKSGGRAHPTCALWPLNRHDALRKALAAGERRIGVWADGQGALRAEFSGENPDPFFNINRKEDLLEAERIAASRA